MTGGMEGSLFGCLSCPAVYLRCRWIWDRICPTLISVTGLFGSLPVPPWRASSVPEVYFGGGVVRFTTWNHVLHTHTTPHTTHYHHQQHHSTSSLSTSSSWTWRVALRHIEFSYLVFISFYLPLCRSRSLALFLHIYRSRFFESFWSPPSCVSAFLYLYHHPEPNKMVSTPHLAFCLSHIYPLPHFPPPTHPSSISLSISYTYLKHTHAYSLA
ncbi:hypothetical protein FPV67DRAFT_1468040, partial [Lyophyllum atratum]